MTALSDRVGAAAPDTCSDKSEQKGLPVDIRRMTGLETAGAMLGGKRGLSGILGITERAVAYKLDGARGVSDGDMLMVAAQLEKLAARAGELAVKFRDEVARVRQQVSKNRQLVASSAGGAD